MGSNSHNFLLNTENHEPLHELVEGLIGKIKENEEIIGRLNSVVDTKFRFPEVPEQQQTTDIIQEEQELEVQPEGDYLRHYLDLKFGLNEIRNEDKFEEAEDPKLKQLLIDNDKLMSIRRAQEEKNRQLLAIQQKYEMLLAQVILPTLSNDISKYNIGCIEKMRESDVDLKMECDAKVWDRYGQYMDRLQKTYRLSSMLKKLLANHIDNDQLQKLNLQLMIVEELMKYSDLSRPKREIGHA